MMANRDAIKEVTALAAAAKQGLLPVPVYELLNRDRSATEIAAYARSKELSARSKAAQRALDDEHDECDCCHWEYLEDLARECHDQAHEDRQHALKRSKELTRLALSLLVSLVQPPISEPEFPPPADDAVPIERWQPLVAASNAPNGLLVVGVAA